MAKKSGTPATPKSAPSRPKPDRAAEVGSTVQVRMYRQGLGDCFLLRFRDDADKKLCDVLIDCGVFKGTPDERERLVQVAENIKKDTDGVVDLLIVTHEHWDHISGFSRAKSVFEGVAFRNVWLGWPENAADPDARAVKAELTSKSNRLRAAVGLARDGLRQGLRAAGESSHARRIENDLATAQGVLDFLGPDDSTSAAPLGVGAARRKPKPRAEPSMDLGETMDWLRSRVSPGGYCSPGERRPVPGVPGVNAYVVGPPRSSARLRKEDPSRGHSYELRAGSNSLLGALAWMASGEEGPPPGPFDRRHRIEVDQARLDPFFRENYGFADDPMGDEGSAWRRIEDEWLGGINQLALQVDTGVNNTSLAIIFELPDGRTLVFPGDAQIGNWLSWADLSFKQRDPGGRTEERFVADLLKRAVLYKVGHHGSHNATLKPGGLEAMRASDDLVALIPTDEDFARTKRPPESGWKMPAKGLLESLTEATRGRILRPDRGLKDLQAASDGSPAWVAFLNRVRFSDELFSVPNAPPEPLYVEYSIPLDRA